MRSAVFLIVGWALLAAGPAALADELNVTLGFAGRL
jgi:hypothetical protein